MKIAYIGWGSLIWNPKPLKTCGCWNPDGPDLPIEFARISDKCKGRLTLVISPGASKSRTLWIRSAFENSEDAVSDLARRERTSKENIGLLFPSDNTDYSDSTDDVLSTIQRWGREKRFDCVVWTNLRPNIDYGTPSRAIQHLRTIRGRAYHDAKEYICNAPQQIKTGHRAVLEKELKLKSVMRGPELTKRSKLRQDLEKRTFYKSADGSFWALVPDKPAAFGHVMMVSWRGRGDQDAADCGIFTDPMHMGEMMKIAHNLVWEMKNRLTSNGRTDGKKCQKVYILVQCETKSHPFHIHLIPRFERCNKANLYLLETELEEARWMRNGDQIACVKDGMKRVRNVGLILKRYSKLIKSRKWAKEDDERSCFVSAIMKWWKSQNQS